MKLTFRPDSELQQVVKCRSQKKSHFIKIIKPKNKHTHSLNLIPIYLFNQNVDLENKPRVRHESA